MLNDYKWNWDQHFNLALTCQSICSHASFNEVQSDQFLLAKAKVSRLQ